MVQAEPSQQLVELIGRIHAAREEEEILEIATEGIRSILGCDRVLFYSREETSKGKIVAESVASGLSRAMGQIIDDPCFDAWYNEKYEQGRVQALENIYEAGLSECYLEQLAKLSIQAMLAAPVLGEGKLISLLIAHQCSGTREWQPSEIELFTQIAQQVGIALNNAKSLKDYENLQKRTDRKSRWLRFYSNIAQDPQTYLREKDLLKATVEEVRKSLDRSRFVLQSRRQYQRKNCRRISSYRVA
ncbi:MAG: GAF domain-containing protein [Hydrococcus sp. RM1_1_31]|nr:GAF domain-containing protein [Hydrococcus sp. RM1_1_31]